MLTLPEKEPCSAIRMTRLSIVASTRPSTTSVSQSSISAPLSLTSGPTIKRAPMMFSLFAGSLPVAARASAVPAVVEVATAGGRTALAGAAACGGGITGGFEAAPAGFRLLPRTEVVSRRVIGSFWPKKFGLLNMRSSFCAVNESVARGLMRESCQKKFPCISTACV